MSFTAVIVLLGTMWWPEPLTFQVESVALPIRGAPVEIRYNATCSPAAGGYYALRVTLAQRTGRVVATGSAEAREACTGRRQTVVLRAVPDTAGTTFRPGRISVTTCLHVRNVVPFAPGRLTVLGHTGAAPCTVPPHTTIVTVPEPAQPSHWTTRL